MAREKAAMHFLNGLLHLLNGHRIFRPPRVRETKKKYEERKFVKKWLNDTVFLWYKTLFATPRFFVLMAGKMGATSHRWTPSGGERRQLCEEAAHDFHTQSAKALLQPINAAALKSGNSDVKAQEWYGVHDDGQRFLLPFSVCAFGTLIWLCLRFERGLGVPTQGYQTILPETQKFSTHVLWYCISCLRISHVVVLLLFHQTENNMKPETRREQHFTSAFTLRFPLQPSGHSKWRFILNAGAILGQDGAGDVIYFSLQVRFPKRLVRDNDFTLWNRRLCEFYFLLRHSRSGTSCEDATSAPPLYLWRSAWQI